MKTKVLPYGYNALTPYIAVKDAVKAIAFYNKAFGAKEVGRVTMPDGTIGHAEMEFGDSKIMIAEESEQWGNLSPQSVGGSPVTLCLYVDDVDKVFERALKEGAKVIGSMVVKDQVYGDRTGSLTDPFGHKWTIMSHFEDVDFNELQKRIDALHSEKK